MKTSFLMIFLAGLFITACAAKQSAVKPEVQPTTAEPTTQSQFNPVLEFNLPSGWRIREPDSSMPNVVIILAHRSIRSIVYVEAALTIDVPPALAIGQLATALAASGNENVLMSLEEDIGSDNDVRATVTWTGRSDGQPTKGKGVARSLGPNTGITVLAYGTWPAENDAFCAADIEKIADGIRFVLPGEQNKKD